MFLKNTDAQTRCRPVEAESLGLASGIGTSKSPSFDPCLYKEKLSTTDAEKWNMEEFLHILYPYISR